jgi:uncharacterized small protein (DUF1192 family)
MTNFRGRRAVAQFDQISRSHLRVVPTEKFPDHHTGHPWLRGIARLQQRVSALESEIERRKDHERSLRKLLRAKGEFVIGLPRGGSSR